MSMASMKYVAGMMAEIPLPYALGRWNKKDIPDVYFIGEYNEIPSSTMEENGRQDVTVILRGFTRGPWLLLEEAKENTKEDSE